MRVVILCGDQPNHRALCHKLSTVCDVVGVVVSKNVPRQRPKQPLRRFANRIAGRLVGRPFVNAWFRLQDRYHERFPDFGFTGIEVRNINDEATLAFLKEKKPELVVVSGTNLIGTKIIELANERRGIVNLHTGLSPYVKGGPNCTNWCLAENAFHLIGNTTMWLDTGIDTGAIIGTENTALIGDEDLGELHWKVMEHAHDLYVRTIRLVATEARVPRVPQSDVARGRTFYSIEWNAAAMWRARRNFVQLYRPAILASSEFRERQATLRTFPIGG